MATDDEVYAEMNKMKYLLRLRPKEKQILFDILKTTISGPVAMHVREMIREIVEEANDFTAGMLLRVFRDVYRDYIDEINLRKEFEPTAEEAQKIKKYEDYMNQLGADFTRYVNLYDDIDPVCGGGIELQWKGSCWAHALANAFGICYNFKTFINFFEDYTKTDKFKTLSQDEQDRDLGKLQTYKKIKKNEREKLRATIGVSGGMTTDFQLYTLSVLRMHNSNYSEYAYALLCYGRHLKNFFVKKNDKLYVPCLDGYIPLSDIKGILYGAFRDINHIKHINKTFGNRVKYVLGASFEYYKPSELEGESDYFGDKLKACTAPENCGHAIGISGNGKGQWCYKDSNGWLIEELDEKDLYELLNHDTTTDIIFGIPEKYTELLTEKIPKLEKPFPYGYQYVDTITDNIKKQERNYYIILAMMITFFSTLALEYLFNAYSKKSRKKRSSQSRLKKRLKNAKAP